MPQISTLVVSAPDSVRRSLSADPRAAGVVSVPCFTLTGGGFPANQCYTAIQGTSMATPHVAAGLALIASAHPSLRGNVDRQVARLKGSAVDPGRNTTPPLSATDTSAGDLSSIACGSGFCHLAGSPISNREAYGAGLLNVARP